MGTITRERLLDQAARNLRRMEALATQKQVSETYIIDIELARIALASLEAEAVGEVIEQQSVMMLDGLVISEKPIYRNIKGIHNMKMMPLGTKFYTAPPAPVSVPDLAALDNLAGEILNHAMNCERRVAVAYTHCAHRLAEEVRDLRAAMLQGAERVTTTYKLPPNSFTDAELEMMSHGDNPQANAYRELLTLRRNYPVIPDGSAVAALTGIPMIPDGYVLVPVEPTSEMQSAAAGAIRFDTTPINKLWTGNAVYKAMIAAAPQQEV